MKRICGLTICLAILAVLFPIIALAADLSAVGSVKEQTAVVYLPGASPEEAYSCLIGNVKAEITGKTSIMDLETPIETIILLDNSLSIKKEDWPAITELLEDIVANRITGEKFTIGTVSESVNYLCTGETDYANLKNVIVNLEYSNHNTQLTDSLYQVLDELRKQDDQILRRIVIVGDGVDDKEIGYTHDELNKLITSIGYPIYAVGCTNTGANGKEQLQNLFALSRLTGGGAYFHLPEVRDSMDIVSAVTSWNNSLQVKVELPAEVCDGSVKMLRITGEGSGDAYVLQLTMPFAEAVKTESEPASQPESESEPKPDGIPVLLIVLVIVGVLVVIGAVVVVVLLMDKRKKEREFKRIPPQPSDEVDAPTEIESPTEYLGSDEGYTVGIWNTAVRRVVLQDMSNSSRRFETALQGEITVGRDAACQIILNFDQSVSRKQCKIFERGGKVMLVNLSKANVTQVNGQTVSGESELFTGCQLKMGRVTMKVEII